MNRYFYPFEVFKVESIENQVFIKNDNSRFREVNPDVKTKCCSCNKDWSAGECDCASTIEEYVERVKVINETQSKTRKKYEDYIKRGGNSRRPGYLSDAGEWVMPNRYNEEVK